MSEDPKEFPFPSPPHEDTDTSISAQKTVGSVDLTTLSKMVGDDKDSESKSHFVQTTTPETEIPEINDALSSGGIDLSPDPTEENESVYPEQIEIESPELQSKDAAFSNPSPTEFSLDRQLVTLILSSGSEATPFSEDVLNLILEVNEKAKLGIDPLALKTQANAGKILLSSLGRYPAIWICQKLAGYNLDIDIKKTELGLDAQNETSEPGIVDNLNKMYFSIRQTGITPSENRFTLPNLKSTDGIPDERLRRLQTEALIEIYDHLNPSNQDDYIKLHQRLVEELFQRAHFQNAEAITTPKSDLILVRAPFLYRLIVESTLLLPS